MSTNLFKVNYREVYFVTQPSQNGSEIVNILSGRTKRIDQKLPMGCVCHAIDYTDENIGTQYYYDILCPVLKPQKVNVGGLFESFAIHMDSCQVIEKFCCGNEIFYLQPLYFDGLRIKDIYQTSEEKMTLKEYISDKINDGKVNCWIKPIKCSDSSYFWVVLPTDIPPKRVYYYSKAYEKMTTMFSKDSTGLGVVVAVGKIAVRHHLINCSTKFELGSTRVCVIKLINVADGVMAVLVKSKPVKLKKRYIETFVTSNGSVLIKTIVKNPYIRSWTVQEASYLISGIKPIVTSPTFNYTKHPFFEDITFSNKMVWSADNLKVVIGATMNSNCIRSPSAKRNDFFVSYHVLGFHDCEKYWRVPDVPDEMYDSNNFLIEIGVPLWGEEASSKKFHPPPFLREISIEGRYLSNRFIKHAENERIPEEKVEEDDYYVTYSCDQISREQ